MKSVIGNDSTTRKWSIGRTFGALFVGLCIAVITLNVALPHGSSAAPGSLAFKPVADTFAKSGEPDRNYGGASRFDVDGKSPMRSYLRFQVGGIGKGGQFRARLRLYVVAGSEQAGLKVFATTPKWDETKLSWNTQPELGPQIAERQPAALPANTWVEIDLGQSVQADGAYSFALTTESGDRIGFGSRSTDKAPQLVLTPLASDNTATDHAAHMDAANQQVSTTALAPSLGDTNPGGCAANEIYVDTQDWWMQTPGASGKEFGHLHTSYCFPNKATITGKMTLHIRSTLHHNPGKFRRIAIQIFAPQVAGGAKACGDSTGVACVNFSTPRTCPIDQTCRWEDDVTFNTADVAYDGWQEIRVHDIVAEPDGTEMRTSSGLHVYLKNGRPIKNVSADPNILMARGWYTNVNYTTASIISPPMGPVSGIWKPTVRLEKGSGGLEVTGWYAALDTDFHNGNPGLPLCSGAPIGSDMQPECNTGSYRGTLSIDTTKLADGWHRLFVKADAKVNVGSTHSGVLAIYFEVRNGQALSVNKDAFASVAPSSALFCDMG